MVLAVRFLDLVKPFTPLIPEIAVPETKTPFQQRLIWTGVTLLIFLVMSQMPLYGIVSSVSCTHIEVCTRQSY
jgi:protein transport protein SEC61 subunit alpha